MQNIASYLLESFLENNDLYSYCVFDTKVASIKEYEGKQYFCYLLIDKTLITEDKKKATILELLFFPLKTDGLDFSRIEPYSLIRNNKFYRIGKIAGNIYPYKEDSDLSYVENKTPIQGVILNSTKKE